MFTEFTNSAWFLRQWSHSLLFKHERPQGKKCNKDVWANSIIEPGTQYNQGTFHWGRSASVFIQFFNRDGQTNKPWSQNKISLINYLGMWTQEELMMQRFGNLKTQGLSCTVSPPQLSCSLFSSAAELNSPGFWWTAQLIISRATRFPDFGT